MKPPFVIPPRRRHRRPDYRRLNYRRPDYRRLDYHYLGVVLLLGTTLLTGCASTATTSSFSSADHLEQQIAQHAGAEIAARVEAPFALDQEILDVIEEKYRPSGRAQTRISRILDLVFTGIDLTYTLTPTRSASETYRAREGNCLSFVNLFVGIARHMRLSPFYVEVTDYQRWDHREGMVVSRGHIVAGIYVDGELETYDFLPYRVKAYKGFQPIDDLTATAHFYNNLGAEALMSGDLEEAYEKLTIAGNIDPSFAKGLNNLGVVYARQDRLDEAIEIYRRGLGVEPDNVPILTNLARAYQQKGEAQKAEALLSSIEDVNNTNPFFFVYKGELALSRGDDEGALAYMREALRRDTEMPEVHLGLVKVFLARGDVKRARHHLSRALRLDATDPEARRYLALLESRS